MLKRLRNEIQGLYASRLPLESFYSIESLLQRWQADGVTENLLCEIVAREELVVGARVRDTSGLRERFEVEDGTRVTKIHHAWNSRNEAPPAVHTYYFSSKDALKILTAAPGRKVGVAGTYPDTQRTARTGTPRLNFYFEKSDLMTCLAEVEKVEAAFRIGSKAPPLKRLLRWVWPVIKKPLEILAKIISIVVGISQSGKKDGT